MSQYEYYKWVEIDQKQKKYEMYQRANCYYQETFQLSNEQSTFPTVQKYIFRQLFTTNY